MLQCASQMPGETVRILAKYSVKANLCILRDRVMNVFFETVSMCMIPINSIIYIVVLPNLKGWYIHVEASML
jgi:hypothetical protein